MQRKENRAIFKVVPNFTNNLYKHQMQFDIIVPLHECSTKYDNQFGAEVELDFCLFVQKSIKYKQINKINHKKCILTFYHLTIASIVCDTDLPSMSLKDLSESIVSAF